MYHLNLPEQTVAAALTSLSEQTDIQVLFPYDIATQHQSTALVGNYPLQQALSILLLNTGLHGGLTDSGVITISRTGSNVDINQNGKGKNMNTNKRKTVLATMVGLFAAGGMSATMAQGQVGESARAQNVLDEIIVTAQKREQNLQDVALAVTAVTSDMMDARGIDSALDLQFSVPGLTIGNTAFGTAQVTMRGVGVEDAFPGGSPGVPIHIDGVYLHASTYILRDFLDIDRVEVLRGPQGTLYGRNAVGGNINIVSKRPTEEFEGELGIDVGNYNKRLLHAVVSGPLSDNLRGRFVISDEERDGYIDNVSSIGSQDLENSDYTSIRGSLVYDVTDDVEIFLSAYNYDDTGNNTVLRVVTDYPEGEYFPGFVNYHELRGAGENITVSDVSKVRINQQMDQFDKAKGATMQVSWTLDDALFTSISSFNEDKKQTQSDFDGSDVVTWTEIDNIEYETKSQEFRLQSLDSELSWIVGLYYYEEDAELNFDLDFDNLTDPNGPKDDFDMVPWTVDTKSWAAFGQVDYPLSENLDLILGLRYNSDEKEAKQIVFSPAFGLPEPTVAVDGDDSWTETTGKIGLSYSASDDMLLYGTISSGYKSGGFTTGQSLSYDAETVLAYELGMKAQWLDNRLQTNALVFYYDYTDKQERIRDAQGFVGLINAADASSYGAEAEVLFRVTEGLTIDFNASYLIAEYDDFESVDGIFPDLGLQDLSGNSLPRSPEWMIYAGIEYAKFVDNVGNISARVDYSWTDDQYANFFNRSGLDDLASYHRTNARLTWVSVDELWKTDLYVQNIEDDDVISNKILGGGIFGSMTTAQFLPPRTYGLKITRSF
jgi:iron complex outermembrane receptor protein